MYHAWILWVRIQACNTKGMWPIQQSYDMGLRDWDHQFVNPIQIWEGSGFSGNSWFVDWLQVVKVYLHILSWIDNLFFCTRLLFVGKKNFSADHSKGNKWYAGCLAFATRNVVNISTRLHVQNLNLYIFIYIYIYFFTAQFHQLEKKRAFWVNIPHQPKLHALLISVKTFHISSNIFFPHQVWSPKNTNFRSHLPSRAQIYLIGTSKIINTKLPFNGIWDKFPTKRVKYPNLYHPCMVYLHTFGWFLW